MSLYIYVPDANLREDMKTHLTTRRWTDSGFDIMSSEKDLLFPNMNKLGVEFRLGMYCAALDNKGRPVPLMLLARSSMSLTPLRLSNQVGLIDAGYRGELIARVDCLADCDHYHISDRQRLFQLVQHNWLPWNEILFVENLEDLPLAFDTRGSGGFGSTGR